jgi:hypothetical protein
MLGAAIALPWSLIRPWPSGPVARRLYTVLGAQAVSLALSTIRSPRVELSVFGGNWRSAGLLTHLVLLLFTLVIFSYLPVTHCESGTCFEP